VAGRTYRSRVPGRMHACGHDAHTSALLGRLSCLRPGPDRWGGACGCCSSPLRRSARVRWR
jgi:metal-dependent amidase/aminoacylase/carboxypeptidase family protein